MSLATTCPNCSTCFRVVQDQLRVSEGWVRCGNCQQVFNALESLFDLDAPHEPVGLPSTTTSAPEHDPYRGVWQTEAASQWMRRQDRSGFGATDSEASAPSHPSEREEPLSDHLRAALHAEPIHPADTLEAEDTGPLPEALAAAPIDALAGNVEAAPPELEDPGETAFAPYSITEERFEPVFEPTAYLPAELQPEVDPAPMAVFVTEASEALPSTPWTQPVDDASHPGATPSNWDAVGTDEPAAAFAEPEPADSAWVGPAEDTPQGLLFQTPAAPEGYAEALPDPEAPESPATGPTDDTPPSADTLLSEAATAPEAGFGTLDETQFPSDPAPIAKAANDDALAPEPDLLPDFVLVANRRARWQRPGARLALAVVGLLLACGLAGQAAWHWRDLLAVTWTPAQAPLQALCAAVGCELEAPRRLEAWVVDNTAVTRPPGVSGYRLSVHLRNRANHPVAVPSFDLVLTDAQGSTISRKVIQPEDFDFHDTAFAAQAEAQWTLEFTLNEGSLVGYTLAAFYP